MFIILWSDLHSESAIARDLASGSERNFFLTARRYASAVYAVVECLCVRMSVTPDTVSKLLNLGSRKQRHTTARAFEFSVAKDLGEIRTGSSQTGAPNAGGVG